MLNKEKSNMANKTSKDWDRFMRIMKTPLMSVLQADLEWAAKQDRFNSVNSKGFFLQEIERREKL